MRPAISLAGLLLLAAITTGRTDAQGAGQGSLPPPHLGFAVPVIPDSLTATEISEFHLRRAVFELSRRDPHAAAQHLERCDLSPERFPEADRAAFLLAHCYRRLENRAGMENLARTVAGWARASPLARWAVFETLESADPQVITRSTSDLFEKFDPTRFAIAGRLLESGDPEGALAVLEAFAAETPSRVILDYLRAVAADSARGKSPEWEPVATTIPQDPIEADLVGAACLRLATRLVTEGKEATWILKRVPPHSRYRPRADHMRGLLVAEQTPDPVRGELSAEERTARTAELILKQLLEEHPHYPGRREVHRFLGGAALERMSGKSAWQHYQAAHREWERMQRRIDRWEHDADLDEVWASWDARGLWPHAIPLDLAPARRTGNEVARAALRVNYDPPLQFPEVAWHLPADGDSAGFVSPPTAAERAALAELDTELARARFEAERAALERDQELRRLARRARYLERVIHRVRREDGELAPLAERGSSLRAELELHLSRLEAIKNQATARFLHRSEQMLRVVELHLVWIRSLQRFHVDGRGLRSEARPPGVPSRAELLVLEEALLTRMKTVLTRFRDEVPALLQRSVEEHWAPRFTRGIHDLDARALAHAEWIHGLAGRLDSTLTATATSDVLIEIEHRAAFWAMAADSLLRARDALRDEVVRSALGRARAALAAEREAIDYGLAASAYTRCLNDLALRETGAPDSTLGPVERRQEIAVHWMQHFLATYPESFARGETRFRLADLLLIQARDEFNRKMKRFLGEGGLGQETGRQSRVPFVDYGPAVALYRDILREDTDFPHRDAVLFNLGMILSDRADQEAAPVLTDLVESFPESPYVQEALLRLGDDRFDRTDFAGCVPLYERAAAGPDAGFTAIALYRIGWAHFSQDRFLESADAFRRLLDLYGSGETISVKADLKSEAESYLIHALARAGGAEAFTSYFETLGPRPYERTVLQGMARLLADFSLYPQAAEVDELFLERYPLDREALTSARRLVESYRRRNQPKAARSARLAHATRFVPRGDWFAANPIDSLREAGEEFARSSLKQLALYHHHRARRSKTGQAESWAEALRLYELLLAYWPAHDDAPALHTYAGETAAELGRFDQALAHYEAGAFKYYETHPPQLLKQELVQRLDWGASVDTSTFLTEVDWQRLTLSDAWYRSTAGGPSGLGEDSLAVRVRHIAQGFAERHPSDPRSADALWRKANLTFAHGWYGEAAGDFGELGTRFPEDKRVPLASALRGDALYRIGAMDEAGTAYETALAQARATGVDSLVTALEPLLPHCAFRHAEQADSLDSPEAPARFEEVAARWPGYEHAGLALYRAGLGYARTEHPDEAVAAWTRLIEDYPRHELAKDAHLQIAATWKAAGRLELAARAYETISTTYPKDEDAPDALLEAADLLETGGDPAGAGTLRLSYVDRFPEDVETGMAILAELAEKELEGMGEGEPISSLLGTSSAGTSPHHLARYLELAEKHPDLAFAPLLARAQFLKGEEMLPSYREATLTPPLEKSIEVKKNRLQTLIETFGKCGTWGVAEWTRASSYRIGEALVDFGVALERSERPPELTDDDLAAYEEILFDEAWAFYDRGEEAWTQILRETRGQTEDPGGWIQRTRDALWPRLAQRFLFRPEVDFPLVAAEPPPPGEPGELLGAPKPVREKGASTPAQE